MDPKQTPVAPDSRTWRYHPDGRAEIFPDAAAAAAAEKEGWLDHPPVNVTPKAVKTSNDDAFVDELQADLKTANERIAELEAQLEAAKAKGFTLEEVYSATDAALKLATEAGIDIKTIVPANGRSITKPDVEAAIQAQKAA